MTKHMRAVLIGVGMVAQTHADAIAATNGRVVLSGVVARRPERGEAFAAKNDTRAFGRVEDISSADAEFAIVATPPNARTEIVEHLCRIGLPILMEKPIERSFEAAAAIVSRCEEARVPLGVVFQHRAREAVKALRDQIQRLGEIGLVEVSVPWWREQAYYDAPGRGTYAQDGGGVLMTQAIHTLDLTQSLAGRVRYVQAMARTSSLHTMEAEDTVTAGLEFASGALGSLFATTAAFPGGTERIVLHGENGVATLEGDRLTVFWRNGEVEEIGTDTATGGGADPMGFTHAWHQSIIEDFAQAVSEENPPLVTGRAALEVHALIDALIQSSDENCRKEVVYG